MRWLLDTDTCVWLLRGRADVVARASSVSPDDLALAAMTLAELRYGALRSAAPDAQERRVELLAGSVAAILPFDEGASRTHAEVRHALRATPIGERDLVIASVAVSARLTLVTGNGREFRRVPGLAVEDWSAP